MQDSHQRALRALERRGRLRSLAARSGIDFSSNDYLGLANAPELREAIASALERGVAVGAGGSRLLRGNDTEHEVLESEAAAFFKAQSALYFGGGFIANVALFSTLPGRGDLIVHDALVHASVRDGMGASKAQHVSARHNDAQSFDDEIAKWRSAGGTGRVWIAVESLYSMDGDRAPLDDLMAIADRHEGTLIIDEAHATGVYGPGGRGLGANLEGRSNVVSLHTCGKALGVSGALVLLPVPMREFLINRCRPFIYATAPSPLMAAGVRAALQICASGPERREKLLQRVAYFGRLIGETAGLMPSGSQIQPVIAGADMRAVALAAALQARGFDVRAVRPPTVPEGTARLRISLTLNPADQDIANLAGALADELSRQAA